MTHPRLWNLQMGFRSQLCPFPTERCQATYFTPQTQFLPLRNGYDNGFVSKQTESAWLGAWNVVSAQ